jgi:hypothetical protein
MDGLFKIAGTLQDEVGGDPSDKGMCFVAYPSLPSDRAESIEERFVNYSLLGSLILWVGQDTSLNGDPSDFCDGIKKLNPSGCPVRS